MITILVVEDEPHQRLLYQMELEDEGYRVILAADGRKALLSVKEDAPDLVVLDLFMPRMDGIKVLSRMMALNPRLAVIIYSGYHVLRDSFITSMADAYLVKSSDVGILKAEIQRVLRKKLASPRGDNNRLKSRNPGDRLNQKVTVSC